MGTPASDACIWGLEAALQLMRLFQQWGRGVESPPRALQACTPRRGAMHVDEDRPLALPVVICMHAATMYVYEQNMMRTKQNREYAGTYGAEHG